MSSKSLVICDEDEDYTARLAAFFNGKKELAFQVKKYNSPEMVQEALGECDDGILLLNERFLNRYSFEEWNGKIIILSETKRDSKNDKRHYIFKYQSCNTFLAQFLENCGEQEINDIWCVRKSGKRKVIGFYSPVHRLGQTTFAFEKAKELAKETNVLYMNLEAYAGDGGIWEGKTDKTMSTLLYYAKQESGNLGIVLTTLICCKNGVDYIPPVELSEDIYTVKKEEWMWLFREILHSSIYNVLILDLSERVQGLFEILDFCDDVYMLTAGDETAAAKIRQYEDNLRTMGYAKLVERMIRCDIGRTIAGKDFRQSGPVKRN